MILMYHKVDIIVPTIWWITPEDLDRQLRILKKRRRIVYLEDYTSPEDELVITFDDAYENVYHHALPVLTSHDAAFEVFVIGGAIAGWNDFDLSEPPTRHMGIDHLQEITRRGGRLQWHSLTHPNLPDLSAEMLEAEMTVPVHLRQMFQAPHFTWFSYPGGSHDDRAVEIARREYSGAVSVVAGEPQDRWQMNRVGVEQGMVFY